jgi:hypothetical protein
MKESSGRGHGVVRMQNRRVWTAWFASIAVGVGACGGQATTPGLGVGGGREGGAPGNSSAAAGFGQSCVPVQEKSATFAGSDSAEVAIDSNTPACAGGEVCLRNHFAGRTSCPYGGPSGSCTVPGTGAPVTVMVPPQCADRRPGDAVYCSCRCANAAGRTDDGASYCTCADSFVCTQLVTSIGMPNDTFSGAYCMKPGTQYDPLNSCRVSCDPTLHPCP